MGFFGIGLGIMVALLWGSGDILATVAARRLSTFKTTFLSQMTSLVLLFGFGIGAFFFANFSFTPQALMLSALIGIFTGLCASLGYLALYRALEIGPVAIGGPLTATSPIFTLILSAFVLQQHLGLEQEILAMVGIFGIVLASTNLPELRMLLRKPHFLLKTSGILWAIVATLAFGTLDFGIGAAVSVSNWFLPALCTRFFTILFLILFSYRKGAQPLPSAPETSLSLALPRQTEMLSVLRPSSRAGSAVFYALIVGLIESVAILLFSFDTRIATTGITSAIASSYGLFVMIFGIIAYRERIAINQVFGICIFMVSVFLLAL